MSLKTTLQADVCLILEGSYPYVAGGVSSWTHDLILGQPQLRFHLLILLAPGAQRSPRYSLPENVTGCTEVVLQQPPRGTRYIMSPASVICDLEPALQAICTEGNLRDFSKILEILRRLGKRAGQRLLLDSPAAWKTLLNMYQKNFPDSSFLDYFWSWRGLLSGLYSVLLGPLPRARIYHAISTGYAGLYLARARIETGRPALVTEHGIYTNERRLEIALADWLHEENTLHAMNISAIRRDLRDMWMSLFNSYSRACYQSCDHIITLFEGNQEFQRQDGARPERMSVIPNGIDSIRYASLKRRKGDVPRIALIGRVVPIKDIKTFIRAAAQVHTQIPEISICVLGPCEEDPEYYQECRKLVIRLGLEQSFEFTGRVNLMDWLERIDLIVLTSISEAQPLVVLEAGAAGIPCIATDVGACRELIEGDGREQPSLGQGGVVVPLANPSRTANAIMQLLQDPGRLKSYGETMRERVRRYYDSEILAESYRALYDDCILRPDLCIDEIL